MAKGTSSGLLDAAGPQSVYKHELLNQYMIRFATMTSKPLKPRRATLVDAFAGRGRHLNGTPASAEQMMMASETAAGHADPTAISIFLVEQARKDFLVLDQVAGEYRDRGVDVVTRHGSCADYLDEVEQKAQGSSLFMFIDPCGAQLPWTTLQPLLERRGAFPRTEALLNFSADFTRRVGGLVKKGLLGQPGVAALDTVCGGTWWREVAMDAHAASGSQDFEAAADAVAHEYAHRLASSLNMFSSVSAVRRNIHHQPVYHLVFITPKQTGLWVMNDAAAAARQKWLHELGPDEDAESGMLFPMYTVDEQIARERDEAVNVIESNLVALVRDGRVCKAEEHATEIFNGVYGIARESYYARAVKNLVAARRLAPVSGKARAHILRTSSPAT